MIPWLVCEPCFFVIFCNEPGWHYKWGNAGYFKCSADSYLYSYATSKMGNCRIESTLIKVSGQPPFSLQCVHVGQMSKPIPMLTEQ